MLGRAIYPLTGVGVMLLLWQAYTKLFAVSRIVLPSPADILLASIARYDILLRETWPTFLESVYGFALAVAIGIPLAVCVANSRVLNLTLYPILVATQSVPKVAIAPIILVWFGLGIESKLAIAFLVAFFPIVVDTARGCSRPRRGCSISPVRSEHPRFRCLRRCSSRQRFRSYFRARRSPLRWPSSAPSSASSSDP
jgi:NitT/TauT family transport system permease protein